MYEKQGSTQNIKLEGGRGSEVNYFGLKVGLGAPPRKFMKFLM